MSFPNEKYLHRNIHDSYLGRIDLFKLNDTYHEVSYIHEGFHLGLLIHIRLL
jgi:hypothetical protein